MFRVRVLAGSLSGLIFTAFLGATGYAWHINALVDLNAIAVVVLGGLTIASFFLCVSALDSGDGISIENHWGGLGGGVGGWRVSLPLAFLLTTLFFGGATVVATGVIDFKAGDAKLPSATQLSNSTKTTPKAVSNPAQDAKAAGQK